MDAAAAKRLRYQRMFYFDPLFFLIVGPAFLLGMWAQYRVRHTFAQANEVPARLSGAAAARHMLDSAGLQEVDIELTPGTLTDHYDPRANVLRLSEPVYHGRTQAAVGIAAHEAGHALQKAHRYAPLVIRNAAVPIASFGSNSAFFLLIAGVMFNLQPLVLLGIGLFATVVFFQVVNLPVEFNASARAKRQLVEFGIVPQGEMQYVNAVLNAAALTYVAATLQAVLTLAYYIFRFAGSRD
jgi:Zn-dependent membrane protease YugP